MRSITLLFIISILYTLNFYNLSHGANTTRVFSPTIKRLFLKTTTTKRPLRVMEANIIINTIALTSWYPDKANLLINQACPWTDGSMRA
jgi:hypothetical protein